MAEQDKLEGEEEYDRYGTKEWVEAEERKGLKFKRTAILVPYRGTMVYMYSAKSHGKASIEAEQRKGGKKDAGSHD